VPTSVVALEILLILLPGFAAAYLVQLMAVRAKQTDLEKVIEALLFSFLIYVTYHVIRGGSQPVAFVGNTIEFHPGNLVWLAALSFAYALAMTIFVNKDGMRLFRKLNLTERTSRSSIWNDTFQDIQQTVDPEVGSIVQVELADGRSVMGVVQFYSDYSEECSVFLKDAQWVGSDAKPVPIPGPGILLTKNANITSISFLNPAE
jgi:Family of unknown function (DUF6338)